MYAIQENWYKNACLFQVRVLSAESIVRTIRISSMSRLMTRQVRPASMEEWMGEVYVSRFEHA